MKKLLLIDAGNTRVKWAVAPVASSEPLKPAGEKETSRFSSAEAETLARTYPEHRLVLACVVPRLLPMFRRAFAKRVIVVTGDLTGLGLRFLYPKPQELGADRLACAVAAQALFPGPAIVLACGTANAFTVLDEQNRVCGGVIAPGWQTQREALLKNAALLRAVPTVTARGVMGKSSAAAVEIGLRLAFRGATREILEELGRELATPPRVLLTGGNVAYLGRDFFARLGQPAVLKPLLALEGLRMIGQRYSS